MIVFNFYEVTNLATCLYDLGLIGDKFLMRNCYYIVDRDESK